MDEEVRQCLMRLSAHRATAVYALAARHAVPAGAIGLATIPRYPMPNPHTTSRLDWRWASDHLYFAQGVRGRYKIMRIDPQTWNLYGVEPGGLTMMALPATGIACESLHAAQLRAERIDRQPPAGEMSGS